MKKLYLEDLVLNHWYLSNGGYFLTSLTSPTQVTFFDVEARKCVTGVTKSCIYGIGFSNKYVKTCLDNKQVKIPLGFFVTQVPNNEK